MEDNQFKLLQTRRLLPLFVTQFLGAVNDNLFKTALVILVTYAGTRSESEVHFVVSMATAIFILPYFLFSATAGQIADKFSKSRLIVWVKLWELGVVVLACIGFLFDSMVYQLTVLFLLGTQATVFGPVKYGILPELLKEKELLGGNALIEAGTFVAILIGTIAGTQLILVPYGKVVVSVLLIALAAGGWAASFMVPRTERGAADLKIGWNIATETWTIIRLCKSQRGVWLSILGISWFWLVGAVFLSQFPTYAKDVLHGDETVVTLFLTVFSIGIGVGSVLCNRILKGKIDARYTPIAAIGITIFALDVYAASGAAVGSNGQLMSAWTFLSHWQNWRLTIDLFLIATCGGLYCVPLYGLLQTLPPESHRARVIAGNNIVNAVFIVASGIASAVMLALHFTVPQIFLTVALLNAVAAAIICKLLPTEVLRLPIVALLRLLYRVEVHGRDNFDKAGDRVVVVANHVSFLDGALLAAFLPGQASFAIDAHIAKRWWVKPLMPLFDGVPLEPANPFSTKTLVRAVESGKRCVIFPEGRITVTGSLMKIHRGPGMIADKANATILPVRIEGAEYTHFSRMGGKLRRRWFPKIVMTILEPQDLGLPPELKGKARRELIQIRLYDIMSDLIFETAHYRKPLYEALLDAQAVHGRGAEILEDIQRKPMTYGRLVTATQVLAARLEQLGTRDEPVGLLLPNSTAMVAVFFALQSIGRIPAMLNFGTGIGNLKSTQALAGMKLILTSRRFVEMAHLEEAVAALAEGSRILYLEDLAKRIGLFDKVAGAFSAYLARGQFKSRRVDPSDTAVILFTSGSEGVPKGVALSHQNILANCAQAAARIDFGSRDIVLNVLPTFHSFGLTGGLLLPLLNGVRSFQYPSPLHYRIVPELGYDANATILFGTDTFLSGYARTANPYDFYSLRYVFAGAERVKDETRKVWSDKFGKRILEGYGATETSPILALNTPMHFKAGTVGRLLPGIRARLEPVPGIDKGGRLSVAGPNVLKGYLSREELGGINPPEEGWYDTGDIVEIDELGYVTIKGRAKRFAKIGGEMVSLAAIEALAETVWPDAHHVAASLPDPKKGEKLVLVTDKEGATAEALLAAARERGVPEIMVPRQVVVEAKIPLLSTGKVDLGGIREIVKKLTAEDRAETLFSSEKE